MADVVERLNALLDVLIITQGRDSEYCDDVRLAIEVIKNLREQNKILQDSFDNLLEEI